MFVYVRDVQPRYGFIVMNRLGVENLNVPLSSDIEMSMTGDYVIYQTHDS